MSGLIVLVVLFVLLGVQLLWLRAVRRRHVAPPSVADPSMLPEVPVSSRPPEGLDF